MSTEGGAKAVLAALIANLGIAVSKFVAFALTGSSSMLSEAIHSVADSGNQVLLLVGGKRARRTADVTHQFGYSRVRYVYAFVVAIILFLVGGLFSLYEGFHKFTHPEELRDVQIAVAVLLIAIGLEGFSFRTAMREANKSRGGRSLLRFVRDARQPELPVVLLEDTGALIGLVFALFGVSMATITGDGRWDGLGAMAVGTLLVVIAVFLGFEMSSMLVGESALPEQEQAIRVAVVAAGFTPGEADMLRRAMGKKKKEILDQEFGPFAAGMRANGYSDAAINTLWDILVPFADYAFNKAHSAGYGLVSYWTAYLKANYPTEYMAALLESVKDNKDKSAIYLAECRHMGVKVLPPDVNDSQSRFTAVGDTIRFGLSAVRNVGEGVVDSIVASRTAKGRFTDFPDFLSKVEASACNKRVVESLIKAGAFDSLGHTRRGLISVHEPAVDEALMTKRAEAIGQFDLFGDMLEEDDEAGSGMTVQIPIGEWDKSVLLAHEREMLGLYVSDHPLLGLEAQLRTLSEGNIADLAGSDNADGKVVTVSGLVTSVVRRVTKGGKPYAQMVVEDLTGEIQMMVFPKAYEAYSPYCHTDAIVVVKGRLDLGEDSPRMMVMDVSVPDLSLDRNTPFVVTVSAQQCTPDTVERLKAVLSAHPGGTEVHLRMATGTRTTVLRLDEGFRVSATPSLGADLKALLGPNCLPSS